MFLKVIRNSIPIVDTKEMKTSICILQPNLRRLQVQNSAFIFKEVSFFKEILLSTRN